MYSGDVLRCAQVIFDYLRENDGKNEKCDLIMGFGHFDMRIPIYCGELYNIGLGSKILFTGGRGAGSADLENPEAVEFKKVLLEKFPSIPEDDIIVESWSTNTGENIVFSEEALRCLDPGFCFENGINKVIAVANPCRQRRVCLTLKKQFPQLIVNNFPPTAAFEEEMELFASKGENLISNIIGEIGRIRIYPQKGFILEERIPFDIEREYRTIGMLVKEGIYGEQKA